MSIDAAGKIIFKYCKFWKKKSMRLARETLHTRVDIIYNGQINFITMIYKNMHTWKSTYTYINSLFDSCVIWSLKRNTCTFACSSLCSFIFDRFAKFFRRRAEFGNFQNPRKTMNHEPGVRFVNHAEGMCQKSIIFQRVTYVSQFSRQLDT